MKPLLSFLAPETKNPLINYGALILRLAFGLLMMPHGYSKLTTYSERSDGFMNFLGLSGPISLVLVIFAEFFCAIFIALGLTTRLAVIPLIIAMFTAAFVAHAGDPIGRKELSLLYMACFSALLIIGPGRFSIDALIFKKK